MPVIENCTEAKFEELKKFIRQFDLDDREINKDQFLTLSLNSQLMAFGRIREHQGVSEMCTLGVLEEGRKKGYGKLMVNALAKKATQPVYLVCIIPNYFASMGFRVCKSYPDVIQKKLTYCKSSLCVAEEYVVMEEDK